jgi:Mce-associated membrane protein
MTGDREARNAAADAFDGAGVPANGADAAANGTDVAANGTGVPANGTVVGVGSTEAAAVAAPEAGLARGRRARTLLVLSAATVVIGAFGIWAAVAAHGLRASAADANGAFTNSAATRAVDQQIGAAVNTIFSYSYADPGRTRTAAQSLLTGVAIRQYNQLFALVETEAPKAKLVVTTRVTNIGVELLTGDRARVLVFANQQDTSAGTAKTTYGGAMFAVTAVNQHGKWKIESIDTFTGPA